MKEIIIAILAIAVVIITILAVFYYIEGKKWFEKTKAYDFNFTKVSSLESIISQLRYDKSKLEGKLIQQEEVKLPLPEILTAKK